MVKVGIYKKHLALWAVLGLVFWGSRAFINHQKSFADVLDSFSSSSEGEYFQANYKVNQNGSVVLDGKNVSTKVDSLKNIDQLRMVLLDNTNIPVTQSKVYITLPNNVSVNNVKVIPRLVHNFTSDVDVSYPTNHIIQLTTPYISGESTYSIELDFPKGALNLPLSSQIGGSLASYSITAWLLIGSILPAITLIILLFLLERHYRLRRVSGLSKNIDTPPSNLPPALVEVLLNGHVSSRSIASTLVDLARRGYLMIGYKDNDFRFGKRKPFALPGQPVDPENLAAIVASVAQIKDKTDLNFYERLILSKIFTSEELITDRAELEMRIGHHLFSEKMATTYTEIYKDATKQNFFIEDPSFYHHQFKLIGLILFYLGFAGFILGAAFFPSPKTGLLPWVGMMVASYIIIRVSPRLPILSDKGIQAYRKWTLFKNYLSNPTPLFYSDKNKSLFETYLPYAIALGVERDWSARFREHPIIFPAWFNSPKEKLSLEEFDRELFPLITWVAKHLSFARTPVVD